MLDASIILRYEQRALLREMAEAEKENARTKSFQG